MQYIVFIIFYAFKIPHNNKNKENLEEKIVCFSYVKLENEIWMANCVSLEFTAGNKI